MTTKQKIHGWLTSISSHEIYDDLACRADFTKSTGREPFWNYHSPEETRAELDRREVGGTLNENCAARLCYGYEIARGLAQFYASYESDKIGRGSAFRECLYELTRRGI